MNKVIKDAKLLALSSDDCLNIIVPLGHISTERRPICHYVSKYSHDPF